MRKKMHSSFCSETFDSLFDLSTRLSDEDQQYDAQSHNLISKNFENLSVEKKTWARIPAQSKASFFPQKDFQNPLIFEFIGIICDIRV